MEVLSLVPRPSSRGWGLGTRLGGTIHYTRYEDGHHQCVHCEQGWRSDLLSRPAQRECGGGGDVPLPSGPGTGGGGQEHRRQVRRETWHPRYSLSLIQGTFLVSRASPLLVRKWIGTRDGFTGLCVTLAILSWASLV